MGPRFQGDRGGFREAAGLGSSSRFQHGGGPLLEFSSDLDSLVICASAFVSCEHNEERAQTHPIEERPAVFSPPRDVCAFFNPGPLGRDAKKARALGKKLERAVEKKRAELSGRATAPRAAVMDVASSVRMITAQDIAAFNEAYAGRFGKVLECRLGVGSNSPPAAAIMSGVDVDW